MNRREVIRCILAMGTLTVTSAGLPALASGSSKSGAKKFFTAQEFALLSLVSKLIIPKTETPGAVEANVPSRIDQALAQWADEQYQSEWREGLAQLRKELDLEADGHFFDQNQERKVAIMTLIDRQALSGGRANLSFYKEIKTLITTAYYTSQPGATEELIYSAVPGEWKPCVPFSDIGKAWATDF